jgi:hypothetical protein
LYCRNTVNECIDFVGDNFLTSLSLKSLMWLPSPIIFAVIAANVLWSRLWGRIGIVFNNQVCTLTQNSVSFFTLPFARPQFITVKVWSSAISWKRILHDTFRRRELQEVLLAMYHWGLWHPEWRMNFELEVPLFTGIYKRSILFSHITHFCKLSIFPLYRAGLSMGRAARSPDTPNRPSRPLDKDQTSVDWPSMVNLKGQTGAGALSWTAASDYQSPSDHVGRQ